MSSCGGDDHYYEEEPTPGNQEGSNNNGNGSAHQRITISFYDAIRNEKAQYHAVRIGEYLWMDSNINHYPNTPISQDQINTVLTRYRLNPNNYKVSINDVNRYMGPYYDRNSYEYLEINRNNHIIYEGNNTAAVKGWGSPSSAEVMQLFAMCGNGTEADVRYTLTSKPKENPAAVQDFTYWFTSGNTNKYGLNLMPGGARFNGEGQWKLEHNHNISDTDVFQVKTGDFYGFAQATIILAWDARISIDDYIKKENINLTKFHWYPIRWCRKLSDTELGYRLYINNSQTDIKKLGLTETPPNGYKELPNGALRGFYVQFIIDKANPNKTVQEMVQLAKKLPS